MLYFVLHTRMFVCKAMNSFTHGLLIMLSQRLTPQIDNVSICVVIKICYKTMCLCAQRLPVIRAAT